MRPRRAVVAALVVTASSVVVGAAATLPLGDPATIQVFEAEGPDITTTTPTTEPPTTTTPEDPDVDRKVWVCVVLVHGNGGWRLKEGQNPIHVPPNANDARDGESPDHPSYIVENGDVVCVLPSP
jgi:hypothetical protein